MSYFEKAIYYKNRLDELKDVNEKLQINNIQLKKIAFEILEEYEKLINEYTKYSNIKKSPVGIIQNYKKQIDKM